ncbi:hypothetical protein HAZT_HAZT002993 [Hyalella azteca]|uniref:Spaetzle domain-containing protein n=1 Tax=Hyalella azteca TaxID=294128 RepID=A0A6A0GNF6_HYAAZ|nr:hypothetical protein HAZT_HAZT002993 [Hyalella azteca]
MNGVYEIHLTTLIVTYQNLFCGASHINSERLKHSLKEETVKMGSHHRFFLFKCFFLFHTNMRNKKSPIDRLNVFFLSLMCCWEVSGLLMVPFFMEHLEVFDGSGVVDSAESCSGRGGAGRDPKTLKVSSMRTKPSLAGCTVTSRANWDWARSVSCIRKFNLFSRILMIHRFCLNIITMELVLSPSMTRSSTGHVVRQLLQEAIEDLVYLVFLTLPPAHLTATDLTRATARWRSSPPTGPATLLARSSPSSTSASFLKSSTRKFAREMRSSTKRCNGDCGCEQKYKWHRMLAYDLENECKGIFVDWFLFPSCCVCRCDP